MPASSTKAAQVTAQMRALITANDFSDGRLPSEPELSTLFAASRATVRQALSSLAAEGLVIRKQGVGTFVNQQVLNIPTRLEEVWDFAEMIRESGFTPGVTHIDLQLGPCPESIAAKLAVPPATEVITTANVFLADGAPVIYCIDTFPAGLVRQAYRDEELHGPVYTFLEERCGQPVSHTIAEVRPVAAGGDLCRLLSCLPGSPLHYFREIGFNSDDQPIIYSEEYYKPAYFSFNVFRKRTSRE
jgi:GntR family transcriptional regulator